MVPQTIFLQLACIDFGLPMTLKLPLPVQKNLYDSIHIGKIWHIIQESAIFLTALARETDFRKFSSTSTITMQK